MSKDLFGRMRRQPSPPPVKPETDELITQIFSADGRCVKCGEELELFRKDRIAVGRCKKCGTPYCNVDLVDGRGVIKPAPIIMKKFPRF